MINFIDNGLAASYFVFSLVAVVGVLQIVAAHRSLVGLSLIPGSRRRATGYLLGLILTLGPFPVFFVVKQSAIFRPGPAGLELLILFGGGTIVGLLLTLIGASLLQRRHVTVVPDQAAPRRDVRSEVIDVGHIKATLCLPESRAPWPALCALSDPTDSPYALIPLGQGLARCGYAVLLLQPDAETDWSYPEVLALAPTALTLLVRRDDIASHRMGLLGFGLGADLALRSGSTDEQVKAIVALAPLLDRAYVLEGLGVLQEMTLPQAVQWASHGLSVDLLNHLESLQSAKRGADRADILFVYGAYDGLVDVDQAVAVVRQTMPQVRIETLAGQGRRTLLYSKDVIEAVCGWLEGRL